MAYRPTRKRKYGIRPVQNVSSGGVEIGNMLNNISANISAIGSNYRQAQFNEAKLDAESKAKINSVNYVKGKDGSLNLQNLSNFKYDGEINDARDRAAINQYYKDLTIANYTNALNVETDKFTSNLYQKNPWGPKAIMQAMDGYIEGLELKDESLKNAVLPNIVSAFAKA